MKCPVVGAGAQGAGAGIEVAAGAIAGAGMIVTRKAPAAVMPLEALDPLACLAEDAVIMALEIELEVGEPVAV